MNPSLATPRDREEVRAARGSASLAGDRLGEGWVADVACVVAAGEALGWFMGFFCLYDGGLAGGWASLMCGTLVRGVVVADPGVLLWSLLWMCACFVLAAVCWLPPCRWPRNGPRAVILVLVLSISVSCPALCYPFRASPRFSAPLPPTCSLPADGRFAALSHPAPPQFFRAARAEASDQLLQELIQTVADKCFAKCITKPGSSLTGGESACLAKCMDRFLEARTLVVKALETQQ